MNDVLRVLLVEDSETDAEILARELKRAGFTATCTRVQTAAEVAAALDRGSWDIIVGDNSMPGFSGTETLALVGFPGPGISFNFVFGTMGRGVAGTALGAGAR